MNTRLIGLALLVLGTQCWAQVGGLYNADVTEKTSVSDPARIIKALEGQWLAFNIPAMDGMTSPCCWKGKWNGVGEAGCSLDSDHQSYGSRSDAPVDNNVIVLSRIVGGKVVDMRVVGESCPVDAAGARVTWIGDVVETDGLDWLEHVARSDQDHAALHAMAVHRGKEAGQRLFKLAKNNDGDLSGDAIFWLGHSRGQQGYSLLKTLLAELPNGENRRQINFALSQNSSPEAVQLLHEISQSDNDPEQRGEAMFWLSQEHPARAREWLIELLETEQDSDVLEMAVFAISQLPDGDGDALLLELAKDTRQPRSVRKQAIFWLAQSESDDSVALLSKLLTK